MTQNPPTISQQAAPIPTANRLIGVGIVIALAALVDFTVLFFPPDVASTEWRLNFMTQVVDRGIIPLMGFTLILLGFWIQAAKGAKPRLRKPLLTIIFLASAILGFLYLGFCLFHLSDANQAKFEAIQRLEQEASQAEAQLDNRLSQEVNLINTLLGNEEELQQLQERELTTEQQDQLNQVIDQLELFKSDPQALRERTAETRDQAISRIRQQKEEAQTAVRHNFRRSAVRIPLSSLMLTIGYLLLSILGFQQNSIRK